MATKSESSGDTETVNADDLDLDSESSDTFVDGAGTEMLIEYRENKWGVADDIEESDVKNIEEIICSKYIERRLTYTEEEMFQELPIPKAEQMDISSQYIDVHADDRHQFVPDEYEEMYIDFPYPETERVDKCTDCNGNGMLQCGNCSGSGLNQCGQCNGSGTSYDSVCGKCGGNGSLVCGACDGNGRIMCQQCEKRGETFKMDFIRRKFQPHEEVDVESPGVPEKYIRQTEGEYIKTDEIELDDNEIKHEVEERELPVAKLDYEYDGKDYSLYYIADSLKAESYPMSKTRKLLPLAVVSVVLLVGALWYFNII